MYKRQLRHAQKEAYDLILLDVMLPRKDGYEVCRDLRRVGLKTPIIMLTAKTHEAEKVLGLETGADDYVTKPFSPRVLVARVRAVLRRAGQASIQSQQAEPVIAGDLTIDPLARTVMLGEESLSLTAKEFDMLHLFATHPRQVFTRDQLLDRVWGEVEYIDPSTVTVHVRRLREKIEADPSSPTRLVTVWGVGYKFVLEA